MASDEELERLIKNSGHLFDPTTPEGTAWFKDRKNSSIWDGFDPKSYAFFLIVGQLAKDPGKYNDEIILSLHRRCNNNESDVQVCLQDIFKARDQLIVELKAIVTKHNGYSMKIHTFGTSRFQMRFVPLER